MKYLIILIAVFLPVNLCSAKRQISYVEPPTCPPDGCPPTTTIRTTEAIPTTTVGPLEPNCPTDAGVFKLSYPGNCSLYFICYNNGDEFEVASCGDGLFFDPEMSACNIAELVDCYDGSITTPVPTTGKPTPPDGDYSCPGGIEFIYLPHPEVCTWFYWCEFGEYGGVSNCGQGLWFSFSKQACVPPYESDCDKEPRPPTTPSGDESAS